MLCVSFLKMIVFIGSSTCQLGIITEQTPLTERGACISTPCLHNGLCTITQTGFICTCVDGYIGVMCERRSDDCPFDNSLECVYGKCKLDMNGYPRCICNDGYEGESCAIPSGGCESKPCLNEGECVDMVYNYKCVCPQGTLGSHCQLKQTLLEKCLSVCDRDVLGGACWHASYENVSVSWGYGDLICNSKTTCFDMPTSDDLDAYGVMEVQMKPISMQYTDNLIFVVENDDTLQGNQFVPHILPMETSSASAFVSCNVTNGAPITNTSVISQLRVHPSLLNVGTQYFLADINALYRCAFGLRLNVTVKTKNCAAADDSDVLCNGRGRCFSDFTRHSYECLCCEGYIGKYCQYEDPCLIKPCENGGTCNVVDYGGGVVKHYCMCLHGYVGDTCDKISNPCVAHRCENQGVCVPVVHSYRCECKPRFDGILCQLTDNMCANILCQNGGTCLEHTQSFLCKCQDGYKGTLCEIEIDECEEKPCGGGTCIDETNDYTCACAVGRRGRHCEEVLTNCSNNNCTNGMCVLEDGDVTCSCGVGYTGLLCEIKLDLCSHPKFCVTTHSLSCTDHGGHVTCVCRAGWTGDNCDVNMNECNTSTCEHGGRCVDKFNAFECLCKQNYFGLLCEQVTNVSVAHVQMEFAVASCEQFHTVEGLALLQSLLIRLFEQHCNCSLTNFIKPTHSRISCTGDESGIFMTQLVVEEQHKVKNIVCASLSQPLTAHTQHTHIHIQDVKVKNQICSLHTQVSESSGESFSSTKLAVGIIVGLLLVILSFLVMSWKVRNIRRKIGASETLGGEVGNFDNTMYTKGEMLKTDKLGETSFMSRDMRDLPKWPAGCNNRSPNLFDRSKRQSPCRKSY